MRIMRTIKVSYRNCVLTFLMQAMLLQSCVTIYKSEPLTLEEANNRHTKTRVVTKTGEKLKFKTIEFENGTYYGVKKQKRQIIKQVLDQDAISEIKIKNRTLSTIVNIPLGFTYALVFGTTWWSSQFW